MITVKDFNDIGGDDDRDSSETESLCISKRLLVNFIYLTYLKKVRYAETDIKEDVIV